MNQTLKKILHKIWDKYQVYDEEFIRKFLTGYKELDSIELRNEFRNWLGGDDVVFNKVEEFLSKPQRARVGGYDFEFKPLLWDVNMSDGDMWVEMDSSLLDPNGKVTLDGYDGNTYDIGEVTSGKGFSHEDSISWEVSNEIGEIIEDQLKDLLIKNFGVDLNYHHNIVYDDQAFDKSLRENILTEFAEKDYDKDITKSFELVINKLLKRKYEWFDRIIINKLSYSKDLNYLGINAELFADEDWVGNQWREYHYSTPIPSETEDTPISLDMIIGGELSKKLQGHFKNVFSIITSEKKPKYMSWSWIDVIPVEMNNKKLRESIRRILREETEPILNDMAKQEQTEGEITERCWKGYTQKGMKTMFGKRYPNCVKKTKK